MLGPGKLFRISCMFRHWSVPHWRFYCIMPLTTFCDVIAMSTFLFSAMFPVLDNDPWISIAIKEEGDGFLAARYLEFSCNHEHHESIFYDVFWYLDNDILLVSCRYINVSMKSNVKYYFSHLFPLTSTVFYDGLIIFHRASPARTRCRVIRCRRRLATTVRSCGSGRCLTARASGDARYHVIVIFVDLISLCQ